MKSTFGSDALRRAVSTHGEHALRRLILAAIEEMLGEAHEVADDTHYTAAFFILGFAILTLFASYLAA